MANIVYYATGAMHTDQQLRRRKMLFSNGTIGCDFVREYPIVVDIKIQFNSENKSDSWFDIKVNDKDCYTAGGFVESKFKEILNRAVEHLEDAGKIPKSGKLVEPYRIKMRNAKLKAIKSDIEQMLELDEG